jgi:hypothetical protein
MTQWEKEDIPDSDKLYMRVHVNQLGPDRKLHKGIFREREGAMSVDWEKYSTPFEARNRAKDPQKNGVITLVAKNVRNIEGLKVEHDPIDDNQAHSEVDCVEDDVEITKYRFQLFKLVNQWEIDPF